MREGRIVRIDLDHRQDGRERLLEGEEVAELLLDHVADHPVGLRAQHVEREHAGLLVGRALQRQHPDLRAVAVGDHELMLQPQRCQGLGRQADVPALIRGGHLLAPPQQGVAAQGYQNSHARSMSRPRGRRKGRVYIP